MSMHQAAPYTSPDTVALFLRRERAGPLQMGSIMQSGPALCRQVEKTVRRTGVIEGDARALPSLIPAPRHGQVDTVICGIPLVLLPVTEQRRFIDAILAVAPGRGVLDYSHCVTSPLPAAKRRLRAKCEAWAPLNVLPTGVWRYTPA